MMMFNVISVSDADRATEKGQSYTSVGSMQSTLRRPEVHTFHRKIGIYTALMGVNDMRAAHVVVKNNTKYKTL